MLLPLKLWPWTATKALKYLQQASLILGRFAFYDMILEYFDQLKVLFIKSHAMPLAVWLQTDMN